MKFSKSVKHGDLLAKRQGKFIRASRNSRIVGSYHMGTTLVMLTNAGAETITIPRGVVIKGITSVRLKGGGS